MDVKIDKLKQIIPEKYILSNEPMKKHTTFRIGGPADIFAAAESIEELPLNLFDAVKELEADQYICDTLGKHASSKYIEAKYAEWDEYRRQIS
mgnify:CR=1 FL=1